MSKWYEKEQSDNAMILYSGVRLYRNFSVYPFPLKMSDEQADTMCESVTNLLDKQSAKLEDIIGKYYYYNMASMGALKKAVLTEKNLISNKFQGKKQCSCFVINYDESISIMVNEEEHIRIQIISSDFNLQSMYKKADMVDDFVQTISPYAYDEKLGYLTSNPSLVGTGLKVFAVLHLPALGLSGKTEDMKTFCNARGIVLKPVYMDGAKDIPYCYEVSNSRTIGLKEKDVISSLELGVNELCLEERKRRKYLLDTNYEKYEDLIYRSYGILRYAKALSTKDAMALLGQLKLGVDEHVIRMERPFYFNKILMEVQPATMQMRVLQEKEEKQRERVRAEYLNQVLPALV